VAGSSATTTMSNRYWGFRFLAEVIHMLLGYITASA
jgi:hypothetical protein